MPTEAAVDIDVTVRTPVNAFKYFAFADPSGGVGDSFTLGIAHADKQAGTVVLDCLVEKRAPFNPQVATEELAAILRSYRLSTCTGDKYAAGWVIGEFAKHGISYRHSYRDRSVIYTDCIPLFTSGRARLLDNRRLVAQLAGLERRTGSGRDRIDHPPGGHDDLSNSAAGALVSAADISQTMIVRFDPIIRGPAPHYITRPADSGIEIW